MTADSSAISKKIVGRLAPSPTGALHVGNARTFLVTWLACRRAGGRLILRIEDIDSPRVKPGAIEQTIADLRWLGLDWDEGPDVGGDRGPYIQTQRLERFREVLDKLVQAERVYPCTCSRLDVEQAASAPHAGQEGPVYPGTCASRRASDASKLDRPFCWRFRGQGLIATVNDLVGGLLRAEDQPLTGDFVVWKANETPAYQLAVVVDDADMGVNQVVRGDDLVPSTFRQRELQTVLGWPAPTYAHVPLVVGEDGRRLAKRHGDTRVATLREQGIRADRLVAWIAWTCGLQSTDDPCRPADLVDHFEWSRLPTRPLVWTPADRERLRRRPAAEN